MRRLDSGPNVTDIEKKSITSRALAATVRLIDETDPTAGGSGVLIVENGDLLIATAAHVAPESHTITIAPAVGLQVTGAKLIACDEGADLAILRVGCSPSSVEHRSYSLRAITIEDVEDFTTGPVFVTGYPGAYFYDIAANTKAVGSYTFIGPHIPPDEWSQVTAETPLSAERDILMKTSPGFETELIALTNTKDFPPPPYTRSPEKLYGLSGCGLWLLSGMQVKGGIWRPSPRLVGIQVSANHHERWLRARRVHLWRELLSLVGCKEPI